MPTLSFNNHQIIINNLGVKTSLSTLGEKRVTIEVRKYIKLQYPNAKVSCSATFLNGQWTGIYQINSRSYTWIVQ